VRTLIVALAIFLFASCASNKVWIKDGATADDFDHDRRECQYEGEKYGPMQRGSGGPIFEAYLIADLANKCMHSRGYRLIDKE
jgi:hypothetical protein